MLSMILFNYKLKNKIIIEVTFLNRLGQSHSLLHCSAFRHLGIVRKTLEMSVLLQIQRRLSW